MHLSEHQLNDLVDRALPAEERAAAEAHLLGCPACTGRILELAMLVSALEALPKLAPSSSFEANVMARVRVRPKRLWRWQESAAAALVILAAVPTLSAAVLIGWLAQLPGARHMPAMAADEAVDLGRLLLAALSSRLELHAAGERLLLLLRQLIAPPAEVTLASLVLSIALVGAATTTLIASLSRPSR
jgi:hypothetical protein